MRWSDFAPWGRRVVDWAVAYHESLRERPVRSRARPGEIFGALPEAAPEDPEPIEAIFADFERIVPPGLTHWQHPRFFAYFPANAAPISVLAEMLTAAIAPQCMLWQTSPAAAEIEARTLQWLRRGLGLPGEFSGVIQDSASTATLAAVLTMRERALGFRGNREGLPGRSPLRLYASAESHSSVERAAWIVGIGGDHLARVPIEGARRGMDPDALAQAIEADRARGFAPIGIVACAGGTAAGAFDPIDAIADVAREHGVFLHVDAAWAGSAMICPEFRELWRGVERADSVVVNPHKWLGAQFDCSAHFLRDPSALTRTLAIRPSYLETRGVDGVVDYSEWSIPLGRRFRALKLWFLLRAHGLEGLRAMIRAHVRLAGALADRLEATPGFRLLGPPALALFVFRFEPEGVKDLDALNRALVDALNDEGTIYLTGALIDGAFAIRFQVGGFSTEARDVETAHAIIVETARALARD